MFVCKECGSKKVQVKAWVNANNNEYISGAIIGEYDIWCEDCEEHCELIQEKEYNNNYREVNGDLIQMAQSGVFNVIAHGCNCMCQMYSGLAPKMAKAFYCDTYNMENIDFKGDINKLGTIDWVEFRSSLFIINAYTQYEPGANLDYDALTLCLRKINHIFKGKHIGLPQIGCGIGGGDWNIVSEIIQKELKDCKVTIVIYQEKN